MAPSPELGQPKAPDKTSSTIATTSTTAATTSASSSVKSENIFQNNRNNDTITNNDTKMNAFDDNVAKNINSSPASSMVAETADTPSSSAASVSSNSSNNSVGVSSLNTAHSNSQNSNSLSSTNLKNWDDCNFKSLLDEAYRYRSPKDRENKSETFLRLLQTAERKEEENEYLLRTLSSRYTQGSNRHKHGGSLQDLDKATHNEVSLDVYGNRSHQHHHNSRPKKYSSVSSRQREGGSLPSNVNVSNCNLSICEQPFLNEENNKRRLKSERTCSGTSYASGTSGTSSTASTGYDSLNSGQVKDETCLRSSGDTIIDMNETYADDIQHLLAHDSLAQGLSECLNCDEGTELSTLKKIPPRAAMGTSSSGKFDCTLTEQKHYVEEPLTFPVLERGKTAEAMYLNYNETYNACKSLLGGKGEIEKPSTIFSNPRTSTKNCDENGNSLNSPYTASQSQAKAKKKKQQSDRNTTTLNVQAVAGYRGQDTVEELVKFIENTDTKKNDKNITVNKKKEKKKEKEKEKDKEINKKEIHNVKKSNSLEELRSGTKLVEDEKTENQVTMRNKSKKMSSTNTSDGKENLRQQNNKRGERRSWGTEELTYLGENNAIEEVREKVKEKEKKKSKENIEKLEKLESSKKKKDDCPFPVNAILSDSLHSESAEFHVVTKKKKAKKRQQVDEGRSGGIKHFSIKDSSCGNSMSGGTGSHKKYQTNSNFSNERDMYLNSLNVNEPRRKSTSSFPPSEKSDSSDLDSVHSLPVESTSNRHHNSGNLLAAATTAAMSVAGSATMSAVTSTSSSPQVQLQSYADIARTVNAGKYYNAITSPPIDKMDKWPTVSGYSANNTVNGSAGNLGNTSHAFLNTVESQGATNKSYKKSLNRDFPYLVSDKGNYNDAGSSYSSSSSTKTIVKQVSYSQSLNEDKQMNYFGDNKSSTTAGTKLTDVIKSSDVTKQVLQKSKSIESDNYYSNIEQYPALEKTMKKYATQAAINDNKLPTVTSNISQITNPSAAIKNQQRSISSAPNINSAVNVENCGLINSIVVNSSIQSATNTSSIGNPNSNSKKLKQQQQQPHQLSTKFMYGENSPNISTISNMENTNMKNKQQVLLQQSQIQQQQFITEQSSYVISAANVNKNAKSEGMMLHQEQQLQQQQQQLQQQQQHKQQHQQQQTGANNSYSKTNKKDKANQVISSSSNDAKQTSGSNNQAMTPTLTQNNNSSKVLNRPAVIILNDTNDSSMLIGNDFTFGDFNEEELRLFDSNPDQQQHQKIQLNESGNFNVSHTVHDATVISSIDTSQTDHDETIHLSPNSDPGYSSANNRSILSEITDYSACINMADTDQSNVKDSPEDSLPSKKNSNCSNPDSKKLPNLATVSIATQPSLAPNTTPPNLGTNYIVAPGKRDISCIINNSNVSNHSELSYDPCIIAVNSVDINRNKSKIIYSGENSVQQQQKTQQLVNQILANSTASSTANINNNSNYCKIKIASGMSSNNNTLPSLLLDSDISANNINSNEVTTTVVAATTVVSQSASITDNTSTGVSSIVDNISPITNTVTSGEVPSNNQKKFSKKEINVRFVAPPASTELNSINFEKIVDFVGLAWEEIVNRGTQFYNGQ